MFRWIKPNYRQSLAKTVAFCGSAFVLAVGFILYFIWIKGTISINGIPLPMLLITIVLPVLMAGLIFRLAQNLDRLENDD